MMESEMSTMYAFQELQPMSGGFTPCGFSQQAEIRMAAIATMIVERCLIRFSFFDDFNVTLQI